MTCPQPRVWRLLEERQDCPHCALLCPTLHPLCPIASQQENRRKYGHKTCPVTLIFETRLNPEPELSRESTKWHTPTHLPLAVLGVKVKGQSLTHWEETESHESWVLSLATSSAAHMIFAIVCSCEPQSPHLEGENRRSHRVRPALSMATALNPSSICGSHRPSAHHPRDLHQKTAAGKARRGNVEGTGKGHQNTLQYL